MLPPQKRPSEWNTSKLLLYANTQRYSMATVASLHFCLPDYWLFSIKTICCYDLLECCMLLYHGIYRIEGETKQARSRVIVVMGSIIIPRASALADFYCQCLDKANVQHRFLICPSTSRNDLLSKFRGLSLLIDKTNLHVIDIFNTVLSPEMIQKICKRFRTRMWGSYRRIVMDTRIRIRISSEQGFA